jgi:TonB family protein
MSAMSRCRLPAFLLAGISSLVFLAIPPRSFGQGVNEHLREAYRGKVFVLRGFPAGDLLRYDSSGVPENVAAGDWTADGFVRVNDIHLSDDRLVIKAERMVAAWLDRRQFELRLLERRKGNNGGKELVRVEIKADAGMRNPSPQQVDAIVSKIFLTVQDSLADLVPDYWKPCVSGGLSGTDKNCVFAPEVLTIPGVAVSGISLIPLTTGTNAEPRGPLSGTSRMPSGATPPRATYRPEPEFSEAARAAKYQGTMTLGLIVDKEGRATNIHIVVPLGCGLDENAVRAVQGWKFTPAMKDGNPVPFEIAVQVDFHLY